MAKQTVYYDPSGPAIEVDLACGYAQDGVYNLYLRSREKNQIFWSVDGDFETNEDDHYVLPGPASDHDGRKVHCSARIILLPPENQYAVTMKLTQGGRVLGTVAEGGSSSAQSQPVDLVAVLIAEEV